MTRMILGQLNNALLLSLLIAASSRGQAEQQNGDTDDNNSNNRQQEKQQAQSIASAGSAPTYLLAEKTDTLLNGSDSLDSTLSNILDRNGPDMRPLRDFSDFDDITLEVTKRAWRLMHHHAETAIGAKMDSIEPILAQTLLEAKVGQKCLLASKQTISAAKRLDSWAIQLLTSWGNFPPTGIFEGTFGDIGSFHGCVNVPKNAYIGHAHYCTISYKPVLPNRKDYELIVRREPEELLRLFEGNVSFVGSNSEDAFTGLLKHAQYSHYIYYKLGACFPIDCSPQDVKKIAKLLGRRAILLSGPVKCHSKQEKDYQESGLQISTRDLNDGVYIWKPHKTQTQLVAFIIIGLICSFVLLLTFVDVTFNWAPRLRARILNMSAGSGGVEISNGTNDNGANSDRMAQNVNGNVNASGDDFNNNNDSNIISLTRINAGDKQEKATTYLYQQPKASKQSATEQKRSLLMEIVDDFSILTNVREFSRVSENQLKSDILCINGLRCITMSWIIITHTMQYNDWSAFARTHEIETHLKSLISQPLFNASYLVDTFFLMSGLLTSYSSFKRSDRNQSSNNDMRTLLERFSSRSYLIGRYLRLTPQIMFVSLLFILLPLLNQNGSPHWYTITGEYSENCSQNWWINLFHIQAFYRSNEMCNFVCWWISVDMFYHLFALLVILLILYYGHKMALISCTILILANGLIQAKRHFTLKLPPNLLSTIPQTGAMWSKMTLELFWTPYAHAFPFFWGFYLGFLMAQNNSKLVNWFSLRKALIGWSLAISLLLTQSYSTYFWVIGYWNYTPLISTIFYLLSPITWSACISWIILACQYNYGGFISRALSCKLFIILGKASYLVYLSHFLVLFTFFGGQNLLLEPTQLVMIYVILGNICLSMLLGSILCVVFEMPWLKTQKRIMRRIR